jgi:hypothetical protein
MGDAHSSWARPRRSQVALTVGGGGWIRRPAIKLVLKEAAWSAGNKEKSGEGLKKGKNNSCWHNCSVETNGCGAVVSILRSSIEVGECHQNGELRKL